MPLNKIFCSNLNFSIGSRDEKFNSLATALQFKIDLGKCADFYFKKKKILIRIFFINLLKYSHLQILYLILIHLLLIPIVFYRFQHLSNSSNYYLLKEKTIKYRSKKNYWIYILKLLLSSLFSDVSTLLDDVFAIVASIIGSAGAGELIFL